MYRASSHRSIGAPWTDLEPIRVGVAPSGPGTPRMYVVVARDGRPLVRIDVYAEWEGYVQEVLVWDPFVAVAWGDVVPLVEPLSRRVRAVACDGYFARLYPTGDRLLVAS